MIRLSTGARNYMLGTGDFQGAFNLCFIDVYSGTQPAAADNAPTGTKLMTYSVNHDGITGGTWAAPSVGVISKTAAENWQALGAVGGAAGWFRIRLAADAGTTNATDIRLDGAIAFSGADFDLADTTIVVSRIYTIDGFTLSMAANA